MHGNHHFGCDLSLAIRFDLDKINGGNFRIDSYLICCLVIFRQLNATSKSVDFISPMALTARIKLCVCTTYELKAKITVTLDHLKN